MEEPKSIRGGLDKDVVRTCNGMWLNHRKEWTDALAATWMDLKMIILCEVGQTEKEKYHDSAYMQNLKKWYTGTN